jgi:hypothetical protein
LIKPINSSIITIFIRFCDLKTINNNNNIKMSSDTQSSAASNPLRKRTKEDFEFGKVIGEGSYSKVI